MNRFARPLILLILCPGLWAESRADVLPALQRMYNFDFEGAHKLINEQAAMAPSDPACYWVRAAAYLFSELDRLEILQSDFFESDKRIGESRRPVADSNVKSSFLQALADCRSHAQANLTSNAGDAQALFGLAISDGLESDYLSLVEKRQLRSLRPAKESQEYALQTLKADPAFVDAKLTTGISEYLLGSLPGVVRWFVHFDAVSGDKQQAVTNLTEVSKRGIYLGPFARVLLSIIAIREKQPIKAKNLLATLVAEFPQNPLFKRELKRLQGAN